METDEGIGVDPVSARGVAAIDQRGTRRVGMREQCVSKRHRRGPGAEGRERIRYARAVDHFIASWSSWSTSVAVSHRDPA